MKRTKVQPIEALDAIYTEAAREDAENGTRTVEERAWARDVSAMFREKLAERRRSLLPAKVPRKAAEPLRPELVALDRPSLVERLLGHYARIGGALQVAHRNLREHSDDDLRHMIQLIEATQGE